MVILEPKKEEMEDIMFELSPYADLKKKPLYV